MANDLGNKEIMAKNIKRLLEKKGLNPLNLAQELGFKNTTVYDWVNAKSYPRIDKIEIMANFFGVEKSDLVENKQTTPTDKVRPLFDQLNQDQQGKAVTYIQSLLDEQREVKEPATLYAVNTLDKAAAGLGYDFTDVDYDTYYTDEEPSAHDLATVVDGDSMEPEYQDGDVLLLVDKGFSRFSGQLCVIAYDGKTYFKKVYSEPKGLRLVSLNPAYQDIWLDFPPTDGYIKIFSVVDSFKPVKK